jgi:hypothetical protein
MTTENIEEHEDTFFKSYSKAGREKAEGHPCYIEAKKDGNIIRMEDIATQLIHGEKVIEGKRTVVTPSKLDLL